MSEVVLGVQFDTPEKFQTIRAGEVWRLFSADYPKVQELSPLPQAFETFGPQVAAGIANLTVSFHGLTPSIAVPQSRFWFMSESGTDLIQFQRDRLLHNWRQTEESQHYPRYEFIEARFMDELVRLDEYMFTLTPQRLRITQCEISYINQIGLNYPPPLRPGDWLNVFGAAFNQDDFALSFRRTVRLADGRPIGRLICESSIAVDAQRRNFINLALTVRGAPEAPTMLSARDFIARGRDLIVRTFAEITTVSAHKIWERMS